MTDKTIIEINGVKLEVDMRYARRVDEIRIGDRVKVLTKEAYSNEHKVHPGIVVGFEPFQALPSIVVAYVENSWTSADVKFMYFNKATKDREIVIAADADLDVDRERIIKAFDRQIAAKQREIEEIEAKRAYFESNFRAYWQSFVTAPPTTEPAEA